MPVERPGSTPKNGFVEKESTSEPVRERVCQAVILEWSEEAVSSRCSQVLARLRL